MNVAKTKTLISCAVTVQLICTFVFAYAKCRFLIKWLIYNSHSFIKSTLIECSNRSPKHSDILTYIKALLSHYPKTTSHNDPFL